MIEPNKVNLAEGHQLLNNVINKAESKLQHKLNTLRKTSKKKPTTNGNLNQKQFPKSTPRKPAQTKSSTTTLNDGTKVTTRVPVAQADTLGAKHTTSLVGKHNLSGATGAKPQKAPSASPAQGNTGIKNSSTLKPL